MVVMQIEDFGRAEAGGIAAFGDDVPARLAVTPLAKK